MYYKPNPVIIDAGSFGLKYGVDLEDEPRVIPAFVANHRRLAGLPMRIKSNYVGNEALNHPDYIVTNPIKKRVVVDWDGMEKLWTYTFQDGLFLREYRDRNIVLTEPTLTPRSHRNKTLEYMFEKYMFGGVYINDASEFAMKISDKTTGLVVDSGEEVTQVVPIKNGLVEMEKVKTIELGGKDVTDYLGFLLAKQVKNRNLSNFDYGKIIKKIKERMCKLSFNYNRELKDRKKLLAYFPLGPKPEDRIIFDIERIKCTEFLFNPSMNTYRQPSIGIAQLVYDTIQTYENAELYYNSIVLGGGNTMFANFSERLSNEITTLQQQNVPDKMKPYVTFPSVLHHNYPSWKGALLAARSEDLERLVMTRSEYHETGYAKQLKEKRMMKKRKLR